MRLLSNNSTFSASYIEQFDVRGTILADLMRVNTFMSVSMKHIEQQMGDGHIKEKLHGANSTTCSSARKAA
jgi:hypothetical protein